MKKGYSRMKKGGLTTNRIYLIVAVAVLILGVGAVFGHLYYNGKTTGIENSSITTGAQNSCLAYDDYSRTLIVGTHDNSIIAFRDDQEIWRVQATGAFSEIEINHALDTVFAGNENNHIYEYSLEDGQLLNDIDAQRRIVALDVSNDGSKIAIATITGTSKANALVYADDGTELMNVPYKVKIGGIAFTDDGENIIIGNNRGELIKIDSDGEETASYETNYSVLQMIQCGEDHMVVCKNGGYYGSDDDLNITRKAVITNTAQAVVKSVGTDQNGEYVVVGSEEGHVFIMNGQDEQIYTTDVGAGVSGFAPAGEQIYMTGMGDFVQIINVEDLSDIGINTLLGKVLLYAAVIAFVLGCLLLLFNAPKVGMKMRRLAKNIWRHRIAYILLLPVFVLIWMFNYRGIAIAFIRAFTNWSLTNNTVAKMDFIGLDNFRTMFTEGYFLVGMKNLVLLLVTGVIKVLTVPVLAAWLVYAVRGDRKKYIYRFLFVLPIVVPGVISALTWQKIYDPNIGLLNEILRAIGLENLQRVWLGNAGTAIWAVIFMGFPFISAMAFLVYYGGFIGIGKEIEESASVDGASKWAIFWKIQLPLIRPQISIMITLTLIGTMQDFNNIYILTGGGPGTATYVPALELYLNVAQFGRYGYACALGVVLFLFTMLITMINMKLTKERG